MSLAHLGFLCRHGDRLRRRRFGVSRQPAPDTEAREPEVQVRVKVNSLAGNPPPPHAGCTKAFLPKADMCVSMDFSVASREWHCIAKRPR
jgi:hypothetical protein